MVAGGFALGYGLNASGLAALVVEAIPFGDFSPLLILVLSGLLCYGLSNFISNLATAALLMPILAVVCTAMGDTRGYRWYVNCSYRCGHCFIQCCGAAHLHTAKCLSLCH